MVKKERGSVLIMAFILTLILLIVGMAFIHLTVNLNARAERTSLEKQAYYAAEAGVEQATMRLWKQFATSGMLSDSIFQLRNHVSDNESPSEYLCVEDFGQENLTYQVFIREIGEDQTLTNQVIVEISSTGIAYLSDEEKEANHFVKKTIVAEMRYFIRNSNIFDFAYFAHNFAWHNGGINNGGSMGTNGFLKLVNGPKVAGGDRYETSDYNGSSFDLINKLDDGGMYAALNLTDDSPRPVAGYSDLYPRNPDLHDGTTPKDFDGIHMPSLADWTFYSDHVLAKEQEAIAAGNKYGIYAWDYDDAQYVQVSDAIYGDEEESEGENLLLVGDSDHPLKVYGTVLVENNVVIKGKVDGTGAIYAGRNVYIAGTVEYYNSISSYRGFTGNKDGDDSYPQGGSGRTALTTAETNQEAWLATNKPGSADTSGTKDLLGLFAGGSICIGNMEDSTRRNNFKTLLNNNNEYPTFTDTDFYGISVNLNETDEARLGPDQVPNSCNDPAIEPEGIEYLSERNSRWDVEFFTTSYPPPEDPDNPGLYAINPQTGLRYTTYDGDIPSGTPETNFSEWNAVLTAVIPGSGEDLDGDGIYDSRLDKFKVVAYSDDDAAYLKISGNDTDAKWQEKLKFDPDEWGSNLDIEDLEDAGNNTFGYIWNNYNYDGADVDRFDAITYTNHLWGGKLDGSYNGTLITRVECTTGSTINHDDRVMSGGSLDKMGFLLPQTQHMEVQAWKER